jgi:hypothetical protein
MNNVHQVYSLAWNRLAERLSNKTSWGSIEIKTLMAECLKWAIDKIASEEA